MFRSSKSVEHEPKDTERERKGAQGIDKGAEWEPNGRRMGAKVSQKEVKGRKGSPKDNVCGTGRKK